MCVCNEMPHDVSMSKQCLNIKYYSDEHSTNQHTCNVNVFCKREKIRVEYTAELAVLRTKFGIPDTALKWFSNYLQPMSF